MIHIYKLKYTDKEIAVTDLKSKGVYNEDLTYGNGIHAVVEIGNIVLTDATYDEEYNLLTPPIFVEGYHFDIMSDIEIDFGLNEIQVKNPKHRFAGY